MNEKLKAKLEQAKVFAKKHAPEIISVSLGVVGAIGWGLAGHYKNELERLQTVDPDSSWPTIPVHPKFMQDVRDGRTLKHREARFGKNTYAQQTTRDEFPDEMNHQFETFKKTGDPFDE